MPEVNPFFDESPATTVPAGAPIVTSAIPAGTVVSLPTDADIDHKGLADFLHVYGLMESEAE